MADADAPSSPPGRDMDPDDFRREGHRIVDWLADYFAHPERFPVLSRSQPGDLVRALPSRAPEAPESFDAIFDDFTSLVVPGITHWNHPGFFAYFAISGSAPGVMAEMLMAALNVNAMLWKTSPAATELEERALDWLRQMLGLGPGWFGVINDTASITTLLALAAAREARSELQVRQRGLAGRPELPVLRIYFSEHAHSSVDKAAITLGIGHENCVRIPADSAFRMRVDALQAAIDADRAAGRLPLAVVATVGTTSTASVDPVPAIAEICAREGAWQRISSYGAIGSFASRGLLEQLL